MYACVDVLILNTTNWKLLPLQLEESKKEMKLIKPWIVRKSCTKTKMQKKLGEHFYVCLIVVILSPQGSLTLSLPVSPTFCLFLKLRQWVVVLCIVIFAVICNNEKQCVFKGWGRSRHQERHRKRGKEQPAVEHQRKEKREWLSTKRESLERVGWPGGCKGIKNPWKPNYKTSESFSCETHKKKFWTLVMI